VRQHLAIAGAEWQRKRVDDAGGERILELKDIANADNH
jgi:hypothetical protein